MRTGRHRVMAVYGTVTRVMGGVIRPLPSLWWRDGWRDTFAGVYLLGPFRSWRLAMPHYLSSGPPPFPPPFSPPACTASLSPSNQGHLNAYLDTQSDAQHFAILAVIVILLAHFLTRAPPSIVRSCPVVKPAFIKYRTASAMSFGRPARFVGWSSTSFPLTCS